MSALSAVRRTGGFLLLLAVAGCGASDLTGGSTPKGLSQSQVNSFASQIMAGFSNGMNQAHPQRGPAGALVPVPMAVDGITMGPRPFADGLPPGLSATLVNVSVAQRTNCTAGGYINVTGSMTGSINDTGTGLLSLQVTETLNSWQCIGGFTMDGDPYVSAAGTFSFINGQQATAASISFGGGFRWTGNGSGSCTIQMTALFNPDHSGHMTGQMCGQQVNITY